MELGGEQLSPKEEGELEDGEIDDDNDENFYRDSRLVSFSSPRPPGPKPHRPGSRLAAQPPSSSNGLSYRLKEPYRGFSQQQQPPLLPPPALLGDSPRSNFWERSHGTFGRFRCREGSHRGRWGRGCPGPRGCKRGGRPGLGAGPNFNSGSNLRRDSPPRKPKFFGRSLSRRPAYHHRNEDDMEETFEDLLRKYKEIQLELECLNREEKMSQNTKGENLLEEEAGVVSGNASIDTNSIEKNNEHLQSSAEKPQVKAFQSFEIKPLRNKLPTPAEMDRINLIKDHKVEPLEPVIVKQGAESKDSGPPSNSKKLSIESAFKDAKMEEDDEDEEEKEEEELSELQLRLLALQSASKKWQQKEQCVMKESKEKLTKPRITQQKIRSSPKPHAIKKTLSAASATKQVLRRQKTRAWKKLQQQKEQEKQRREDEERKQMEEEERKKREEEIRKIRDLSNQEEQYNRFMKLVGGKRRSSSKSTDIDIKKSQEKPTEESGNLYQYDNYEEVAMETDSETNSPVSSPVPLPFSVDYQTGYFVPMPPVPIFMHQNMGEPFIPNYLENYLPCPLDMPPPPPPPPLPPEEPEQPPKPPFADEEEEEEMLLREELLKSIANRRALKPEDSSDDCDLSLPPLPIENSQSASINHFSTASLNSTLQPRPQTTKFVRGPSASRPLIVIPRHKSVVVRLDDSDDSESDNEQPSLSMGVFGGLESMIREARRTAEASKPKPRLKAEKENDPAGTKSGFSEGGKKENRPLKEENVSREKQRVLKSDLAKSGPSPVHSDAEVNAVGKRAMVNKQLSEVEERLRKHNLLLTKDESLLSNLLQQEAKKKEALRQAEVKYMKHKEQLQAAEKIVNANRMLLKKLQEQIHKVKHRIQVKKSLSVKYEEFARAKALASREVGKRKREQDSFVSKNIRLDGSSKHTAILKKQSAEYIAMEKKRLQQLEYEYRLKIQKLKEAQALRNAGQPESLPGIEEEQAFVVSQPSLHDLTQDKLVLDTEENDGEDEVQSPSLRERRRSFRESNSFTKPNLKHTDLSQGKETLKPTKKSFDEPELFLGLNIDDLKKLHGEADDFKTLLQKTLGCMSSKEKSLCGQEIPVNLDAMLQSRQVDLKPTPFGTYSSPLLVFKSYRFSPYFRNKEKLLISSVSYSNLIDPKQCFCRFDLTGTCNDDDCQWQHMRDCILNQSQLFQDLLSYNLSLIKCSDFSTDEEIRVAAENYVDKQFGKNKDRMTTDEMAVLLVSKVNESTGHTPPYTTFKEKRKWKPKLLRKQVSESSNSDDEQNSGPVRYAKSVEHSWSGTEALDAVITPDDVRYFTAETDDIANLETSVMENPQDVQLWIKLTYKYLNQREGTPAECLDAALNALARALEINRANPEIWCHYLNLFSKRGTKEEVQEMCETAVQYASTHVVWWTYLMHENSFEGKDYVCSRLVQFLMETIERSEKSEILSFQLLQSLLFWVQLSLFTGRQQNALAIFQNALKTSDGNKSVAEYLNADECCLAWLAYIHLIEFNSLPSKFFDPAVANPSKLVTKEPFLIPWQSSKDIKTHPDTLLALFEDAVQACSGDCSTVEERITVCLSIYRNMISALRLMGRWEAAENLCKTLLQSCPAAYQLTEALADLYLERKQIDDAVNAWLCAFRRSPHNAQLFYYAFKFFISVKSLDIVPVLFQEFINSFFEGEVPEHHPTYILRHLLNYPMPYDFRAPSCKEMLNGERLNTQIPYLWLIFCLWQSINASTREAADTFEAALSTVMQNDVLKQIWMDYLVFTNSQLVGTKNRIRDFKLFTDLVHRCLVTVPTRMPIPFSSAKYWTNYEFHNQVISFYLSCLPQSQHCKALERFPSMMPTNVELALRILEQEWKEGNIQHLKLQLKMYTHSLPICLPIWKIAIVVESMLRDHQNEVRHLYQRALQKLPLCASLWKDQLLFEASEGGKTDNLRKLVARCQEIGVSLDELLNLSPSQNRGH
ncbi:zinc finger C3H1 domain-containing protein-like isoform X2 [Pristis pectinata]|uniref:zinc finger C3H1 domain-containing protein-like isoform X2 n=1 Tax=Pristis pectinata TaxID=685728 RepID=UPI00223CE568|nr:zinc finger C3H1 domain-containing protein-like isoform X2 [Pristis pectinata]